MGVSLALKKLDRAIEGNKSKAPICTLGPIIHNPQVLETYARLGVKCIEDIAEITPGSVVIIRAHGVPRQVEEKLKKRSLHIVDATCPKVKRAQLLIGSHFSKKQTLLLYGEADHPEVQGLLSYAGEDSLVFNSLEEIKGSLHAERQYFLAAQTTQDRLVFDRIKYYIQGHIAHDLPVLNTICEATKVRQDEAVTIAKEVDKMVVVGGYSSGNTRRLVTVVQAQGTDCTHVETATELDPGSFQNCQTVGLTAGASTHYTAIEDVRIALLQSGKNL